ncbi:MAG: nuclear transport factor 2 family protein [Rubrobacteraceae bacterium]
MLSDVSKQTGQTLQSHLRAFGQGDVDAMMDDYSEDVAFIKPDGVLRGKSELRAFTEEVVAGFPPGSAFELSQQIVEGEIAYIVWSGESEALKIPFAAETLIVRGGKIVAQTFAAQMELKTDHKGGNGRT